MKAQDKQMIRDLAALIGEQIIDTAEKAEAVVKAKEKADRKERKAAAKRRARKVAKKAAKGRHPSTALIKRVDRQLADTDELVRMAEEISEMESRYGITAGVTDTPLPRLLK